MDIYYFCFYLWEFSCILYIHPVADKSCIWNLWRFKSVFCLWIFPYGAILPCFFFFVTSLNCTHGTPEVLYWACLFSVRGFAFVILARNCSGDSLAFPWPRSKCSGLAPSLLWSLRLSLLVPALLTAFVLKALAFPFTYHSVQVPAYLLALEVPCFPENPVKHLKNMLFIIQELIVTGEFFRLSCLS